MLLYFYGFYFVNAVAVVVGENIKIEINLFIFLSNKSKEF